jgi:hypothetical protein
MDMVQYWCKLRAIDEKQWQRQSHLSFFNSADEGGRTGVTYLPQEQHEIEVVLRLQLGHFGYDMVKSATQIGRYQHLDISLLILHL